ncbi:hypothetical protein MANES_16G133050v8 [Manihot esculenta]|uniref:Uncharacterized protein n=1 Tax=Manihot esculenta TaxID=3983 RepID=A0ACB7G830_MANES|nr:hypothetical protein MANES_16G133050v8 [Manihot esculenta]
MKVYNTTNPCEANEYSVSVCWFMHHTVINFVFAALYQDGNVMTILRNCTSLDQEDIKIRRREFVFAILFGLKAVTHMCLMRPCSELLKILKSPVGTLIIHYHYRTFKIFIIAVFKLRDIVQILFFVFSSMVRF